MKSNVKTIAFAVSVIVSFVLGICAQQKISEFKLAKENEKINILELDVIDPLYYEPYSKDYLIIHKADCGHVRIGSLARTDKEHVERYVRRREALFCLHCFTEQQISEFDFYANEDN